MASLARVWDSALASSWDLSPVLEELQRLWDAVLRGLPLFVLGLTVLLLSFLFARTLSRGIVALVLKRTENRILSVALEKTILVLVLVSGSYLFLRITNLTRVAAGLLGGTGLLGLILGLAFRDIAENLLASLLISIQRPFRIGDTIELEGHKGVVEGVTLRGTVLMDFDGNFIQIANSTIYKATIKNYTANPKIRVGFTVGIGYDTDIEHAQETAFGVLQAHAAVLSDPEPLVLVERLGSATVDLRIYGWIDGHVHSNLKVESSLMAGVVEAFLESGISMPDEAREVVFPKPVPIELRRNSARAPDSEPRPEHEELRVVRPRPERSTNPASTPRGPSRPAADLRSEVADLRKQASTSRSPEEGANLLEEDAERPLQTAEADA